MVSASYTFRLDPCAADYDAAIQWNEAEEPSPGVDVTVERTDKAVRPPAAAVPGRVFFVDGVRRVEHRLLVEGDAGSLYGLLGSFGVGAACLGHKSARITHEHIGRLCVVGGGVLMPGVNAPVPGGRSTMVFEPRRVPENTPMAQLDGLQTAIGEGEAPLAEALGDEAEMVVLDGPLTFLGSTTAPPMPVPRAIPGISGRPLAGPSRPRSSPPRAAPARASSSPGR
jgi:hypothetical protein